MWADEDPLFNLDITEIWNLIHVQRKPSTLLSKPFRKFFRSANFMCSGGRSTISGLNKGVFLTLHVVGTECCLAGWLAIALLHSVMFLSCLTDDPQHGGGGKKKQQYFVYPIHN